MTPLKESLDSGMQNPQISVFYPIHNPQGRPLKSIVKKDRNKFGRQKIVNFNEKVVMHKVESYKDYNVDMAKISKNLYKAENEGCTVF